MNSDEDSPLPSTPTGQYRNVNGNGNEAQQSSNNTQPATNLQPRHFLSAKNSIEFHRSKIESHIQLTGRNSLPIVINATQPQEDEPEGEPVLNDRQRLNQANANITTRKSVIWAENISQEFTVAPSTRVQSNTNLQHESSVANNELQSREWQTLKDPSSFAHLLELENSCPNPASRHKRRSSLQDKQEDLNIYTDSKGDKIFGTNKKQSDAFIYFTPPPKARNRKSTEPYEDNYRIPSCDNSNSYGKYMQMNVANNVSVANSGTDLHNYCLLKTVSGKSQNQITTLNNSDSCQTIMTPPIADPNILQQQDQLIPRNCLLKSTDTCQNLNLKMQSQENMNVQKNLVISPEQKCQFQNNKWQAAYLDDDDEYLEPEKKPIYFARVSEMQIPDPFYLMSHLPQECHPLIAHTYKKDCRTWLWKSKSHRQSVMDKQKRL